MDSIFQYSLPLIGNLLRYFIFAGIPFLIFYVIFSRSFTKNKIQERLAKDNDFIREILQSIQTNFIIAAVIMLFLFTPLKEYTQVYFEIEQLNDEERDATQYLHFVTLDGSYWHRWSAVIIIVVLNMVFMASQVYCIFLRNDSRLPVGWYMQLSTWIISTSKFFLCVFRLQVIFCVLHVKFC